MKRKNKQSHALAKVVGLIIILLLSLKAINFATSEYKSTNWKNDANLVVAVNGQDHLLAVWNLLQKKIYIIKIPKDAVMNSGPFSGDYTLDSILKLGVIDGKKQEYYVNALSHFFGVPVTSYYENENLSLLNFDINFRDIFFKKSSLTIFDYFKIKSLLFRKEIIDLPKRVRFARSRINNQVFMIFGQSDLDDFFGDIFQDKFLSGQGLYFKIYYSPNLNSELHYHERIIENIGFKLSDVEEIENGKKGKANECVVKKSSGYDFMISDFFHCKVRIDKNISYDVAVYVNE